MCSQALSLLCASCSSAADSPSVRPGTACLYCSPSSSASRSPALQADRADWLSSQCVLGFQQECACQPDETSQVCLHQAVPQPLLLILKTP